MLKCLFLNATLYIVINIVYRIIVTLKYQDMIFICHVAQP